MACGAGGLPAASQARRLGHTRIALFILAGLLAGCIPEKRIVWSPDGSVGAVATPNGLYFIKPDGAVLKPRLTGTATRCDWFPDGRRLAVVHTTKAKKWADIAGLFDAEQQKSVEQDARKLHERLLAHEGSLDGFKIDPDNTIPAAMETAMMLFMVERLHEGLPEKFGDKWEQVKDLEVSIWRAQVFTLEGDKLAAGPVLVSTLNEIHQPRVAPNGKNVALLKAGEDTASDAVGLHVVSAQGGPTRVVGHSTAFDYDWSPDGRSLAFIYRSPAAADESRGGEYAELGTLATIQVADAEGALLKQWEKLEDKVGLLFHGMLGVRWLSDGRILFASAEVTLPATKHDMPQQWSLYVLDPRTPASVCRVLRRDLDRQVEFSLPRFAVSPDEKRVLLPGANAGVICYEFASGQATTLVESTGGQGEVKSLPIWRTNAEACFVRPGGSNRSEVVLAGTDGTAKVINKEWPEEMQEGWLSNPPASAPATTQPESGRPAAQPAPATQPATPR
jgi:dipeptidyl aminopeptidase/acylaminoacyl peptidase